MPFLLGFLMAMAGFALLVLDPVPLPKGRSLPKRPARIAGIIWLCFFPAAFAARWVLAHFEWEEDIHPGWIYWSLVLGCLAGGLIPIGRFLFRPAPGRPVRAVPRPSHPVAASPRPAAPKRVERTKPPAEIPAPLAEEAAPWVPPGQPDWPQPAPPSDKNPFDFS
jgi:hypothetical protein